MNTIEMTTYANNWLKENYNMSLQIPIEINNRLRTSLGRFHSINIGGHHKPIKIDMNGKFIKHNTREEILLTLKHELVHYALCVMGLDYHDGDYMFENELNKHSLPSNFHNENVQRHVKMPHHVYTCDSCGCDVKSRQKINTKRYNYTHKHCGGTLTYKGQGI